MDSHPETMGYFRPISFMNTGKKSEAISRLKFEESVAINNNNFIDKYK